MEIDDRNGVKLFRVAFVIDDIGFVSVKFGSGKDASLSLIRCKFFQVSG
jgi:hypothetical protein